MVGPPAATPQPGRSGLLLRQDREGATRGVDHIDTSGNIVRVHRRVVGRVAHLIGAPADRRLADRITCSAIDDGSGAGRVGEIDLAVAVDGDPGHAGSY